MKFSPTICLNCLIREQDGVTDCAGPGAYPPVPTAKQVIYDTVNEIVLVYSGAAWVTVCTGR